MQHGQLVCGASCTAAPQATTKTVLTAVCEDPSDVQAIATALRASGVIADMRSGWPVISVKLDGYDEVAAKLALERELQMRQDQQRDGTLEGLALDLQRIRDGVVPPPPEAATETAAESAASGGEQQAEASDKSAAEPAAEDSDKGPPAFYDTLGPLCQEWIDSLESRFREAVPMAIDSLNAITRNRAENWRTLRTFSPEALNTELRGIQGMSDQELCAKTIEWLRGYDEPFLSAALNEQLARFREELIQKIDATWRENGQLGVTIRDLEAQVAAAKAALPAELQEVTEPPCVSIKVFEFAAAATLHTITKENGVTAANLSAAAKHYFAAKRAELEPDRMEKARKTLDAAEQADLAPEDMAAAKKALESMKAAELQPDQVKSAAEARKALLDKHLVAGQVGTAVEAWQALQKHRLGPARVEAAATALSVLEGCELEPNNVPTVKAKAAALDASGLTIQTVARAARSDTALTEADLDTDDVLEAKEALGALTMTGLAFSDVRWARACMDGVAGIIKRPDGDGHKDVGVALRTWKSNAVRAVGRVGNAGGRTKLVRRKNPRRRPACV